MGGFAVTPRRAAWAGGSLPGGGAVTPAMRGQTVAPVDGSNEMKETGV